GNKEEVAPMFFSRQDVEGFLAELRKRDPKIAESAKIRVSSLDQLVALMEQKNDPQLRQIYFVPASSAIRFVQQQQGNRPPQPPAAPAPQPQSPR
ncbi:MAG: Tic22 family protein, partial [Gloeomargarita sp. GXS_bins_116]